MNLRFVPYYKKYDAGLHELEQAVVQGNRIKLEMVKDHFLSRTTVFKKYYACLVVDETDKVIATAVGARTHLIVNNNRFAAGVCYDVKVHPRYRNKGIGKRMAKHFYQTFLKEEGLTKNFITLKLSNNPVVRLVSAVRKIWLVDFVYLTLPAKARIPQPVQIRGREPGLTVVLFDAEALDPSYTTELPCGLAYFHTHMMYRLAIRSIHPLLKWGMRVLKRLQPKRYNHMPQEGDILQFACLYNHDARTIQGINSVLEKLEAEGINYLLVCCRKGDVIYRALHKQSINTYGYYMLTDFPVKSTDSITMDVRCL